MSKKQQQTRHTETPLRNFISLNRNHYAAMSIYNFRLIYDSNDNFHTVFDDYDDDSSFVHIVRSGD